MHAYIQYTHMSVNTHLGWVCQFWACGVYWCTGVLVYSVYLVCECMVCVCVWWTRQRQTPDPDFWGFGARSAAETGGTGPLVLGLACYFPPVFTGQST